MTEHRLRLKDRDVAYLMVGLGGYIVRRIEEGATSEDLDEATVLYDALRRALKWSLHGRRGMFFGWWDSGDERAEAYKSRFLEEIGQIGTEFQIPITVPKAGSSAEGS